MKKFPRKYQYPLMLSMVFPSMLFGMSAIVASKNMTEASSFLSAWGETITQVVPSALLLLAVVAPTVRLFVSKILLEPEEHKN